MQYIQRCSFYLTENIHRDHYKDQSVHVEEGNRHLLSESYGAHTGTAWAKCSFVTLQQVVRLITIRLCKVKEVESVGGKSESVSHWILV